MVGLAAAVLGGLMPALAGARNARIRVGATAPLPRRARIVGRTASATPISFTVALQPQSPAGLHAYATAVSTPGNPLYGRYLTVAQFARRFGATPRHVAAVRRRCAPPA